MNTSNESSQSNEKEKKSKKNLLLLLLLLLIIILLVILIWKSWDNDKSKDPSSSPSGGVHLELDPNAGEYEEQEKTNTQGVAIPGWGTLTIPANQTDVTVDFFNPEANKDLYYLTFELRLLDDSEKGYEVLYTSGLVEPSLHIQKITLNRALSAGTYDAVIHVQPYRMNEEKTPTNNADMKTSLVVK